MNSWEATINKLLSQVVTIDVSSTLTGCSIIVTICQIKVSFIYIHIYIYIYIYIKRKMKTEEYGMWMLRIRANRMREGDKKRVRRLRREWRVERVEREWGEWGSEKRVEIVIEEKRVWEESEEREKWMSRVGREWGKWKESEESKGRVRKWKEIKKKWVRRVKKSEKTG